MRQNSVQSVADSARQVRERLNKNSAGFALFMGVPEDCIDQCESGEVLPPGKVLLALLHFAKEGPEQNAVLRALGATAAIAGTINEVNSKQAFDDLQKCVRLAKKQLAANNDVSQRGARQVNIQRTVRLLAGRSVDPVVAKIMRQVRLKQRETAQ